MKKGLNKLKDFYKNNKKKSIVITIVLLSFLVSLSYGVYKSNADTFIAREIRYYPTKTNIDADNVQNALEKMYEQFVDSSETTTSYLIQFNSNGGSSVTSQNVSSGSKVTKPSDPTRDKYIFKGWYSDSSLTTAYNFNSTVTSSFTLYAKWVRGATLTFDANGGTPASTQIQIESGQSFNLPDDPVRSGYTFLGWYTAAEGGSKIGANILITGDTTYYAHWVKRVKITFNGNGGTPDYASLEGDANTGLGLTLPGATREGYIFVGWYTAAEGGSLVDQNNYPSTDTIYYAHWSQSYTITYDCTTNGSGTCSKTTDSLGSGASVDLYKGVQPPADYEFVGWHTSSTAHNALSSLKVGTSNITLYAIYKKMAPFTLTFYENGSSLYGEKTKECNLYNKETTCDITMTSPEIIRNTHTIIGFNHSSSAQTSEWASKTQKTVSLSENVSYYAITKKELGIQFFTNGNLLNGTSNNVTKNCTIWNKEDECSITSPTIVTGDTVVGFNVSSEGITSDWDSNTSKNVSVNTPTQYYAIVYKKQVVTFHANNNTISLYGVTASGDNVLTNECKIWNDDEECTMDIPTIVAPYATQEIYGFYDRATLSATDKENGFKLNHGTAVRIIRGGYPFYQNITKDEFYAITKASSREVNVTYSKGEGIESIGKNSDKCTISETQNGIEQSPCTISLPTITQKSGYQSGKWYNESTTYNPGETRTLLNNASFEAKAEPITHTVIYDYSTNGGQSATKSSAIVAENKSIDLTVTASKSGYSFIGWNTDKDATTGLTQLTMGTNGITLYAIFSNDSTYKITFVENGSTLTGQKEYSCKTYNAQESCKVTVTSPTISRGDNYDVIGYNTDSNAQTSTWNSGVKKENVELFGNKKYYAISKKNMVITFNANNNNIKLKDGTEATGTNSITRSCTLWNNKEECGVEIPAIYSQDNTPYIEGFKLNSTSTRDDPGLSKNATSATVTKNGAKYNSSGSTATQFYAVTSSGPEKSYNVKYNKAIGVKSIEKTSDTCTKKVGYNGGSEGLCYIVLPTFELKDGYSTGNWYNDDVAYKQNQKISIEKNMSFEARSTDIVYTIGFETFGGTSIDKQVLKSGETVTKPSNPSKVGYIFTGWYKDYKLQNKYDFSTKVNSSFTLYAKFDLDTSSGKGNVEPTPSESIPDNNNSDSGTTSNSGNNSGSSTSGTTPNSGNNSGSGTSGTTSNSGSNSGSGTSGTTSNSGSNSGSGTSGTTSSSTDSSNTKTIKSDTGGSIIVDKNNEIGKNISNYSNTELSESDTEKLKNEMFNDSEYVYAFDTAVKDTNGNNIDASNTLITYKIPIPYGISKEDNIKVFIINGNEKKEISYTIEGNYIVFTTNGTGRFVIVKYPKTELASETDSDNTVLLNDDLKDIVAKYELIQVTGNEKKNIVNILFEDASNVYIFDTALYDANGNKIDASNSYITYSISLPKGFSEDDDIAVYQIKNNKKVKLKFEIEDGKLLIKAKGTGRIAIVKYPSDDDEEEIITTSNKKKKYTGLWIFLGISLVGIIAFIIFIIIKKKKEKEI